jgi:SPFH domain / Band 7 family
MALKLSPLSRSLLRGFGPQIGRSALHDGQLLPAAISPMLTWRKRSFSSASCARLPASLTGSPAGSTAAYFQRPSLPANTIIRFVPQQTAWIVERMGKFNRILKPGLAILIPFIDRIAYVQSLKESAMEIPSQSAITADNVTLDLDGVLYTRVFDAYKAR